MKKILYWGTHETAHPLRNQKIILTNLIVCLLVLLNFPFTIITYLYFPALLWNSLLFLFSVICALILNYFRLTNFSRIWACTVPATIYLIYHAYVLPANQIFISSLYIIQLALIIPVFLIFDIMEKKSLFYLAIFNIALLFILPYLNNFFEMPLPFHLVNEGIIANTFVGLSVIGIFITLFIMRYLTFDLGLKNEALMGKLQQQKMDLEEKNVEAQQQQRKLSFLNERAKTAAAILTKANNKLKTREAELKEVNLILDERRQEIESQNEEMKQQQEELKAANDQLEIQHREALKQNKMVETQKIRAEILVKNLEVEVSKQTFKLRDMLDDMTKQNEDLKQFSYIISHNIRSPIAHLLGLLSIFNRTNMNDPFNQEVLRLLEDSAKNLDIVIRDLTQIIAIRNNLNKVKEKVDIRDVIEFEKSLLKNEINNAQALLTEDLLADNELFAIRSYVQSITHNLISNAIKYKANRRQLHIKIKTEIIDQYLCLSVQDNGLGIELTANTREKLFGLYQRMHDHVEGKGLGLYMVKTQVEVLGGKIEVESELNKGTVFKVYFLKNS
jgi:signal transduction histidine kinase